MSQPRKQLLDLFHGLSTDDRRSLLDYAEFLSHRAQQDAARTSLTPQQKLQPKHQEKPENENLINAIKRMRATYFMLNTDELLNETSTLMTQHIVHGRAAAEVIGELEALFESHYQKYLQS